MFDTISLEQAQKLTAWQLEQDAKARAAEHHYGASGGAYTWEFTPTTLGMVVKVTNNFTRETIDLTDYKDW